MRFLCNELLTFVGLCYRYVHWNIGRLFVWAFLWFINHCVFIRSMKLSYLRY